MTLVEETFFGTNDKIETSIMALKAHEDANGYFLAFSGGKDSIVIKRLADMAGVKYEAHYHCTTVDPPDLLRYIRQFHKDVIWDFPRESMYRLIIKKGIPPTRLARYCCEHLKEGKDNIQNPENKVTMTGVRKAESNKRKTRKLFEHCYKSFRKTVRGDPKYILNPIIDWSDDDVWDFIRSEKLPYCKLYDEGWKRIGCVGCPMNTHQKEELERFPGFKKMYLKAFEGMLLTRDAKGIPRDGNWTTAENVYKWWIGESAKPIDDAQCVLFE